MAATYFETAAVELAFDRAIDIAGIDVAAVIVRDGVLGFVYGGEGSATLVGPSAVQVMLTGLEEVPSVGITLTVSAANGIVALDDGSAWAGVTELELPYP